jgi:hypothetical protein
VKPLLAVLTAWLLAAPAALAETRAFSPAAADHRPQRRLTVSDGHRAYLRFDVALPPRATVTGARLRLYATPLAPAGTVIRRAGSRRRLAVDRGPRRGWRLLALGAVDAGPQTFVVTGRGRRRSRYRSPQLIVTYRLPPAAPAAPAVPAPATPVLCPVPRPQTTWRAPGSAPLGDAAAAACVVRSGENRPQNTQQNAEAPTAAELELFRSATDASGRTPAQYNANFARVTGGAARYGLRSTDDLIEWAAYKWGVPEDLVRGQMVMESGWSMLQKGDRRDWGTPVASLYPALAVIDSDSVWESLGIAQIRWRHTVPWNPGVEPLRWQSTAFALDYSQALIRYYFDGYCDWCGAGYTAGDADGAYRTYVSGSWSEGQWYADGVRSNAASKTWEPVPAP